MVQVEFCGVTQKITSSQIISTHGKSNFIQVMSKKIRKKVDVAKCAASLWYL